MNRIVIPVCFYCQRCPQAGTSRQCSKQDSISPVHRAPRSERRAAADIDRGMVALPRRRKWRRCSGIRRGNIYAEELLPLQSPCTSGTVGDIRPPVHALIPYVATAWTNVAGWTGLGWSFSGGGCVKEILGMPDDSTLWTYAALCR